ncbi:hypothetical protein ACFPK1_01990 [Actinomycetospora rhizophila]|uniref:Uncharacterized protein n=1 Tax=Actinomycetospora rhizophila TaxID=1416876 RepID=A0ABV9Z645_9PSEU
MVAVWKWERQSPTYGNYGNANQWTLNAGLDSLARETAQNSNDARRSTEPAELVYTLIRLTGERRRRFEEAMGWDQLEPHLRSMGSAAAGAVTAGQIQANLEIMRNAPALTLLRIADYGCRGLGGPELTVGDPADYGDFIKLCRLDLFSGKDEGAGGSFGLGKAVYWRFSRIQTVIFNSSLPAVAGDRPRTRLFGVNQGVVHRVGTQGYQGRGCFGDLDDAGNVVSSWDDERLADDLYLGRHDPRPGTSALLVGFHDPDQPEKLLRGNELAELHDLAKELRNGIEENFWPLLTRGGLRVRIEVDDGEQLLEERVDPEETFTELVRALRRFDAGDVDQHLGDPYSVVVRDVPVEISRRRTGDKHPKFGHTAKLVVTISDTQKDTLENQVCLFRRPEMVVQKLPRTFEGTTYHAFLVAGAAMRPGDPPQDDVRADDFLRFSEPPAHDRWVPGRGASQANLSAHYVAPWLPNLRAIEKNVMAALVGLFGSTMGDTAKPPRAVVKNLDFLRGSAGPGGAGTTSKKPDVDIKAWEVEDGRWHITFEVRARNRAEGWSMRPSLALVGLDGSHQLVPWEHLESLTTDASVADGILQVPRIGRGRSTTVRLRASSTRELLVPAGETGIDVVLRETGPLATAQVTT